MDQRQRRRMIFEDMPVRQAVLRQIGPAVLSQMVALLYNLADTYFVGLLNLPAQTAAVTVSAPPFLMLTAVSNLFGVGGASALSRALGRQKPEEAKRIGAVSFWMGVMAAVFFSVLFSLAAVPLLTVCGAKADTLPIAWAYTRYTIVFGGVGTVLNILLANLVRSEGGASAASFGLSLGGILNIVLDPLFVLPAFAGMGAAGAGLATGISNLCATVYFLIYLRCSKATILSLRPGLLRYWRQHLGDIVKVGFPSALQYALTVVAVAAQSRFVSKYATEAVAALGIVKKLDQLPLFFSIGVASGLLPLLAYNYASGNVKRRESAFRFGCTLSLSFAVFCVAVYELLAPHLAGLFIKDAATVAYAASFLRRMVLAMPLMSLCYPLIIHFQAMGKARESLICSVCRKGVLDIPLLFLLDGLAPLYGIMWVQPIVDAISLCVALFFYKKLKKAENPPEISADFS